MLGVTIRMGAAHYEIETPDGQVLDLSKMTKPERNKARRLLVGVFTQATQKGNA